MGEQGREHLGELLAVHCCVSGCNMRVWVEVEMLWMWHLERDLGCIGVTLLLAVSVIRPYARPPLLDACT